ncbi:MAG TPA: DUF6452 family protein [Bacteroidales bacterium]|nr:DUF6452 family protein [Bacteroidales bacterium]
MELTMRNIVTAFLAILLTAAITSCGEDECDQSLRNLAGFAFYSIEEGTQVDSVIPNLSIYAAAQPDTLLYDSLDREAVYLPLNPTQNQTRFVFVIDSIVDTVSIDYTRKQEFVSHPCGFITRFQITQSRVSHSVFDSIQTINPIVTLNENEEHFRLYLPPADTVADR